MIVSLPTDKESDILDLLQNSLTLHHISIRHLAKIIRKLISCTIVCPLGKLYYRSLERLKTRALKLQGYKLEATCRLDRSSKDEINWWIVNLPNCSAPIYHPNPQLSISFDSCSYGSGCTFQDITANGHFSPAELPLSINTKEILAIWYGYMSFNHLLKNTHMLLLSNNTTAVSYVWSMGGMSSELCTRIVRDFWNTAVRNNTWFSITHIPGNLNTKSDIASRFLNTRMEWEISPSLFNRIKCHHNMAPSIDLFASWLNKKLPKYCVYIYAPFNLLSRVMAKIKRDRATALVICPAWPNQLGSL